MSMHLPWNRVPVSPAPFCSTSGIPHHLQIWAASASSELAVGLEHSGHQGSRKLPRKGTYVKFESTCLCARCPNWSSSESFLSLKSYLRRSSCLMNHSRNYRRNQAALLVAHKVFYFRFFVSAVARCKGLSNVAAVVSR